MTKGDIPTTPRGGNLGTPTRHPLNWRNAAFRDEASLFVELERVFDACNGCRRCESLCNAFPRLFELVGTSSAMELGVVARRDYWKVVDDCYLCDLCYQVKCPYVPPHEWNIDFPHLMLRAKALQFSKGERRLGHRLLGDTQLTGRIASIPLIGGLIIRLRDTPRLRKLASEWLDIHPEARLPVIQRRTFAARFGHYQPRRLSPVPAGPTRGKVALFTTCYCNFSKPDIAADLVAVFQHNGIPVKIATTDACCGMPKLEQGDLRSVDRMRQKYVPHLAALARDGWDIVAPVPSCVLMFKQELPLMDPGDEDVRTVQDHVFDPFEYLAQRHEAGLFRTTFHQPLGKIVWHAPCHQRAQNIGPRTREVLALVPGTEIETIERCSGHGGTYGIRNDTFETSQRIARPVIDRAKRAEADYLVSDCPEAATRIASGLDLKHGETNPLSLLRKAYGI